MEKNKRKYFEGDVWEEHGKKWTIKNGIKQTLTALDELRSLVILPLKCPVCGKALSGKYDKKFWGIKGKCMDCVIQEDTLKIITGTFKLEERRTVLKNMIYSLTSYRDKLKQIITELESKSYVTENGIIEDWSNQYDIDNNIDVLNKKIEDIDVMINNYEVELNNAHIL
jgi:hypothetical protein